MDARLFAENLAWLEKHNPALYRKIKKVKPENAFVIRTSRGEYNLIKLVKGVQYPLYSGFDSARQALVWAKEMLRGAGGRKFTVLFGLGLGYELDVFLKDEQAPALVLVEPDEEIFYYFLHFFPLSRLEGRRVYFIQDNRQEEIEAFLSEVIKHEQSINFSFCPLGGYVYSFREQIREFEESLRKAVNAVFVSVNTVLASDRQWFQNYILNLKQLAGSVPVEKLEKEMVGLPAVLVGAGPSLEYDVEVLRKLGNRALIVPVGSAFSVLEYHGVKGHAVGAIDGNYAEAEIFQANKFNKEISLFYSHMVNYKVLPLFGETRFFFALHKFDEYIYRCLGQPFVKMAAGASVSISILDMLAKLGCNPIILTGQDFCYPEKKNYARGAVRFSEINEEELRVRGGIKEKNKAGQDVYTTRSMLAMRAAMERVIENYPEITFYNCSRLGLPIRGCADAILEEVGERLVPFGRDIGQKIKDIHRKYKDEIVTPQNVAAIEKRIEREARQIKELCGNIIQVLDRGGGKDRHKLLELIRKSERKLAKIDFYTQVINPETGAYVFLFSNLDGGMLEDKEPGALFEVKRKYYAKVYELCLIILNALEHGSKRLGLLEELSGSKGERRYGGKA